MIADIDMVAKYPVSGVGNRSATATLGMPLSPQGMFAAALGERGRPGLPDQQVWMAMGVKALREQHQSGQEQRQKRRRADVERDNQGDGHVPPPMIRIGDGRSLDLGAAGEAARPRWRRNLCQASSKSEKPLITGNAKLGVRVAGRIREREQEVGNAEIRL
jgi:hypothetical protein